ncbi:MAG TPA: glycosyltransferase family 4 protein [Mycobacteriales bacterium]|nr:glycosyltransferase family 4 protein [Mycobacteriales bacterium]
MTTEPRRLRIAIVGPTHPYKGGIAQHTTELARRLSAAGHDVRLVSWSAQYPALLYPGQQTVAEPEIPPYAATTYPLSWRRPDSWWRVGRRLAAEVDWVVVVMVTPVQVPAYLTILRAMRGGRARVLALCHNVLPHERRGVDERLVRAVLSRADAVLVHSPAEAALARSLTGVHVAVCPLPAFLRPAPPDLSETRSVRRRLLFFGLVRPYKGLEVLLRALPSVPDVDLVVAGEFWQGVDDTRALVDSLGLTGRVEIRPGYVPSDDVPALFRSADALVVPYLSSTGSQHAYLAFEYGIPVVATRVGALPEQVRDGVDGLLCEPGDADSLAAALRRLYEPGMLDRLRSGIRPVDADAQWKDYLDVLVSTLTGAVR